MDRGLEEVVSDLLREVDQIKEDIDHFDKRFDASIERMNFSVKRLVRIESSLEDILRRLKVLEDNNNKKG